MKQYTLEVHSREDKGSGVANRLRRAGNIPAVAYGVSGTRKLAVNQVDFRKLWVKVAGATAIIEINDDKKEKTLSIIQDVQRDPLTDQILHIDFHEVESDKKMHASVTIHVFGESVGVKNENGFLDIQSHEVEVNCLPQNLPEFIEIDVSDLHAGQAIHIKDLIKLDGVDYLNNPEDVIVSCIGKSIDIEEESDKADDVDVINEDATKS